MRKYIFFYVLHLLISLSFNSSAKYLIPNIQSEILEYLNYIKMICICFQ